MRIAAEVKFCIMYLLCMRPKFFCLNSTITAGLPLCVTFSFMWSLWEIFSNSVVFFSWNLKLHCQVRKIKEPFTIQPFHSYSPIWEFCPELFSLNIGNFLPTYPNISMSRAAKGGKIMFKQREQQHGKQWPKATALRACPNPLNTSGGGFFLKKGKLQATVHLQIHRYRLPHIMITRESCFICVLSEHPVGMALPACHDGAREVMGRWCQPTYSSLHWSPQDTVLAVCCVKCQTADLFLQYSFTTL